MARLVKRVPLDFNAPLKEVWEGYSPSDKVMRDNNFPVRSCTECTRKNKDKDDFCNGEQTPYCILYNSKWRSLWYKEPPEGVGYQMWENTSEGSPVSPVFKSDTELAEYCAENVSVYGDVYMPKEKWLDLINNENFSYQIKGLSFIYD